MGEDTNSVSKVKVEVDLDLDTAQVEGTTDNSATVTVEEAEDLILDGMHLLLQRGEQERIIEFKANELIHYGKGSSQQAVELKNAQGMPNYSSFRVKLKNELGGEEKKAGGAKYVLEPLEDSEKLTVSKGDAALRGKDNRDIFDDNKAQKMNASDIRELREKGATGSEILETLISNSSSFSRKTEYSQEKYVRKKERTYGDTVMFIKPTLSILAEYYFKKDPLKVLNLRPDTLSQMLSYANVHAHGKYLVYETGCSGLVVAAILTRLAGLGLVLHVHAGSTPQRQAVNLLNFKPKDILPLKSLDVFYLVRQQPHRDAKAVEKVVVPESTVTVPVPVEPPSDVVVESESEKGNIKDLEGAANGSFIPAKAPAAVSRADNEKSVELLASTLFSGLIIAGKEHPLTILQRLLPSLAPSATFVVFSQLSEPLGECYMWLKEKNRAVNIHLVENWCRNIQVDTERTHPEINMSSNSGYFLTGIATC